MALPLTLAHTTWREAILSTGVRTIQIDMPAEHARLTQQLKEVEGKSLLVDDALDIYTPTRDIYTSLFAALDSMIGVLPAAIGQADGQQDQLLQEARRVLNEGLLLWPSDVVICAFKCPREQTQVQKLIAARFIAGMKNIHTSLALWTHFFTTNLDALLKTATQRAPMHG